jgi:propionyl-CoA synthetase
MKMATCTSCLGPTISSMSQPIDSAQVCTTLPTSPHLSISHLTITGQIEQVILSHPSISEASVVGIPDPLKGHLPFAFITPRTSPNSTNQDPLPAQVSPKLFSEVNALVREQIGAIASLGGMIQGRGMIPKTRSGKTLRRVLRELVENAAVGRFDAPVSVPPTVEDVEVVEVARGRVREYFGAKGGKAKL